MHRRSFLGRTSAGLAATLVSRPLLSSPVGDHSAVPQPGGGKPGRPVDFTALRSDFPPLKTWTYLDTAFIGLLSHQVKAAHERHLDERFRFDSVPENSSILNVWMDRAERIRRKVAAFIGAKPDEIAFTLCTGSGSNIALNGIDWRPGDNVVVDDLEYPTDLHILNAIRRKGVDMRIVRNRDGLETPEQFAALADKRTRAFVVCHVCHANGLRHDLKTLADIIHGYNGYLVVDAAQSIGGIKVDVGEEKVDFLSGIPYKWLNGPNGVGFLYVRKEIIPGFPPDRLGWASTNDFKSLETLESNPLPDTARRFEYGTLAFESVEGLGEAIDYLLAIGPDAVEKRALALAQHLRGMLTKNGVRLFTPENTASPIVSCFLKKAREMNPALRKRRIYVTARAWAGEDYFRVSPHFYNTEEDIERFVWTVLKLEKAGGDPDAVG